MAGSGFPGPVLKIARGGKSGDGAQGDDVRAVLVKAVQRRQGLPDVIVRAVECPVNGSGRVNRFDEAGGFIRVGEGAPQSFHALRAAFRMKQSGQRRDAVPQILTGGLSECARSGSEVERVIRNLEGHPHRTPVSAQRVYLIRVRAADYGTCLGCYLEQGRRLAINAVHIFRLRDHAPHALRLRDLPPADFGQRARKRGHHARVVGFGGKSGGLRAEVVPGQNDHVGGNIRAIKGGRAAPRHRLIKKVIMDQGCRVQHFNGGGSRDQRRGRRPEKPSAQQANRRAQPFTALPDNPAQGMVKGARFDTNRFEQPFFHVCALILEGGEDVFISDDGCFQTVCAHFTGTFEGKCAPILTKSARVVQ